MLKHLLGAPHSLGPEGSEFLRQQLPNVFDLPFGDAPAQDFEDGPDGPYSVQLVDLRATGDGRHRTRWDLVVRLDTAGYMQVIEFLDRTFLPTSPDF